MIESSAVIVIYFFSLCLALFLSFFKAKGGILASVVNILATVFLSLNSFSATELSWKFFGRTVFIDHSSTLALSMLGLVIVLLIGYSGLKEKALSRLYILYSFILFISYALMGSKDWASIFICYKIILLVGYTATLKKGLGFVKNIFSLNILQTTMLTMGIFFYFLGTKSLDFQNIQIINQDFFLLSLFFFAIFLAMELGLFPFNIWFEEILKNSNKEKIVLIVFIRRMIVGYFFISTIHELFSNIDFIHKNIFWEMVKYYVLANFIVGSVLLLSVQNLIGILTAISMMNMALIFLKIGLEGSLLFKGHLLLYLFAMSISLVGLNLLIDLLYPKSEKDYMPEKLRGLFYRSHGVGPQFVIFMLCLIGFPLTIGFPGKFLFYSNLFGENIDKFVIILIFLSLFPIQSVFKVFSFIFQKPENRPCGHLIINKTHQLFLYILISLVIIGGVAPSLFLA